MAQKKFIIDGGFKTTDDSLIEANLEMTGHILPTVDSDGTTGFDLGSTTKKWRDLYLSEGSLYIDGQKVIESNSGTIVVQADPNQSLTTQVSGTGVLTLTSATTVSIDGTLQMASGKKITDVNGDNVQFGDKIDMDSNKIINVGTPTDNTDAANKSYVDGLIGNIATDAITEGDSELEIADLGTGTVGITVDGTQRFALSASSLAMTVPITISGVNVATETYADTAEADAKAYTDTQIAALDFNNVSGGIAITGGDLSIGAGADVSLSSTSEADFNGNTIIGVDPDVAGSPALCASSFRPTTGGTDLNLRPASGGAVTFGGSVLEGVATPVAGTDATNKTYVDTAQAAAQAYTDTEVANLVDSAPGAIDTLNELAAALGDDANFSATMTTALATKAATTYVDSQDAATLASAQSYADTAEADAIATASSDATSKADAALASAQTYADTAEADAISTAATDATTKADAAETNANAYTDAREAAITTAYQGYADTAESDAVTAAAADATAKANQAEADAIATAAADATTKADAAQAAAATDATSKANAAQSAAEATASADATAKVSAEASARATAIATAVAGIEANISTSAFHSGVTDVTNASTLAYTFSELVGADDYTVYVNRMLTRASELSSVNTSTGVVTFASSVIEVGDEIEVKGWKLVS